MLEAVRCATKPLSRSRFRGQSVRIRERKILVVGLSGLLAYAMASRHCTRSNRRFDAALWRLGLRSHTLRLRYSPSGIRPSRQCVSAKGPSVRSKWWLVAGRNAR